MPAEGNGRAPIFERVRRALRGGAPALPIGEAVHPIALAAVVVLVVNDWVLKPQFGPSLVTGKLSDVAGLVFAPLALSALIGLLLALAAALGARVSPPLTHRRLALCVIATGGVFAAVKLDGDAARALAHAISWLGRPATIYLDRSDLLCLPALAIAVWIGRDELGRIAAERDRDHAHDANK